MAERIVVRSDEDNHVLFSVFKAYYPSNQEYDKKQYEHKHTELEISCILGGKGKYNCCGVDYPFSPGSVFLHCGNDIHYFSDIEQQDGLALLVMRFDSLFLWSPSGEWSDPQYLKLFKSGSSISRCISDAAPVSPVIGQLLNEIFDECSNHRPSYELMVKAKLMTILANMVRHFHSELSSASELIASRSHLERMEQSIKYILSHLGEELTLNELAQRACMSRSYYSAIFKELNGVSVWDYIISQRVDLAKYKLETSDDPITQVCEDSGFTSIGNFNRAFKKLTGKTPREYRKQAGKM